MSGIIQIFALFLLSVIAVGVLGTAYILRNGFNQKIKGTEALNRNLGLIEKRLADIEQKKN